MSSLQQSRSHQAGGDLKKRVLGHINAPHAICAALKNDSAVFGRDCTMNTQGLSRMQVECDPADVLANSRRQNRGQMRRKL